MRGISKLNVRGKKILLRVDINCPVENGKIVPGPRIEAHAQTIKILSGHGAQVIIFAHQGRKGKPDFLSLEQHAREIHHVIKKDVAFVDDVVGPSAKEAIAKMKDGDVLLLDNVRRLTCEETPHECLIVKELAPLADYFVLDALSVAHRKHSSVIGFEKRLPSFAGHQLEAELEALDKVKHSKDLTFVLGGSKVEDSFAIMRKWLSEGRVRKVLVAGALATLLLHAKGFDVKDSMKFLEVSSMESHCGEAKKMLEEFGDRIVLPVDVGMSVDKKRHDTDVGEIGEGQIWDIGPKTSKLYEQEIYDSHAIVMNGPAGVYEVDEFSSGTRIILEAIERCDAFSLIGGGHTITAIEKFNLKKEHFGYVSLSGKALIEYLSGHVLPGLKALEENEKQFPL